MPRPRRGRRPPARATAAAIEPDISDHDDAPQTATPARGRGRLRRSKDTGIAAVDQEAIRIATQSRDAALKRLADEDPTTTSGNAVEDSESGGSVELGRRVVSTPEHRRDTTGLDLADDDVFGDLDDGFEDGDVPRGRQSSRQSSDASSLNLSSFKRRPRQSSIIGRNDPPIRPSSRGGNTPSISSTLNLGVFRRRAREPSILGTARKPRPDETITVPDSESESEDDFEPEAESTPLNRRRTGPASDPQGNSSPEASSKPKSRKRKSEGEEAHPSSDRPEKISRLDREDTDEDEEDQPAEHDRPAEKTSDSDADSSLSSISLPSGPSPVLPERPSTPINSDEIMAPPASSGSEDADDIWPDIHTLAKRRRRPSVTTPIRVDDMSDISSPPSLTHSPNYEVKGPRTKGRQQTRRQPSPKVTTADLTGMLPKRRYKKTRDPFDLHSEDEIDNSALGRDDDELSYLDTAAARRRRGGSRAPSRSASRPASRGGRTAASTSKPQHTKASARQARQSAKTYSRRSSDKENEGEEHDEDDDEEESRFIPLPDETFDNREGESSSTPSADELKQAARKFKEVDRWELEFEEVTQSSSPSNAR